MTDQECTPKFNLGDRVWIGPGRVSWIKGPDSHPSVDLSLYAATCKQDELIPDHPALPAVARWLAEHGGALRYGQHTPGDWLDVVEATFDEQDDAVDRLMLAESVMPALRALIAALTEGV